ncbi:hypothetical protein, partial [Peribacillus sp. NPDC058075]|uniref:hypothetical protein n=1 Tax=unclassified Peribacillus TaxID=2675266 RepID=UPI0036D823E5
KCLTCSFAFLIVCAHLKFNVGALFCSVFKEQYYSSLFSDFINITPSKHKVNNKLSFSCFSFVSSGVFNILALAFR